MQVVVVTGDPLASSAHFAPTVPPSPQAVQDRYFVPEGPVGIDGRNIRHLQIGFGQVRGDVGSDDSCGMRVKGGFRAGFDLDCPPYVGSSVGGYGWIPKQQALPIWIVRVGFDTRPASGAMLGTLQQLAQQL